MKNFEIKSSPTMRLSEFADRFSSADPGAMRDAMLALLEDRWQNNLLRPAEAMIEVDADLYGFAAVMLATALLEPFGTILRGDAGVCSSGADKKRFATAFTKVFGCNMDEAEEYYGLLRCGLFHDGDVRIINLHQSPQGKPYEKLGGHDLLSPREFVHAIAATFTKWVEEVRNNPLHRDLDGLEKFIRSVCYAKPGSEKEKQMKKIVSAGIGGLSDRGVGSTVTASQQTTVGLIDQKYFKPRD